MYNYNFGAINQAKNDRMKKVEIRNKKGALQLHN